MWAYPARYGSSVVGGAADRIFVVADRGPIVFPLVLAVQQPCCTVGMVVGVLRLSRGKSRMRSLR